MKKTVVTLALTCAIAMASEYTTKDRIKDMQDMAGAMNDIQTGFFYNNYDMVGIGVERLDDAIGRLEVPKSEYNEKDPLKRYMNNKVAFTDKIAKYIKRKSITILERFKDGDPRQAAQAFTKITKKCMECHQVMRGW
jgi:hypothetical protein